MSQGQYVRTRCWTVGSSLATEMNRQHANCWRTTATAKLPAGRDGAEKRNDGDHSKMVAVQQLIDGHRATAAAYQ